MVVRRSNYGRARCLFACWVTPSILYCTLVFMSSSSHMAVQGSTSWPVVFDAIRAVHPQTPIVIFGGIRSLFSGSWLF